MRDDSSWAARYQFLAELWRGRDRVIFDPWLERRVLAWGRRRVGLDDAARGLLEELLPTAGDGERGQVWMILAEGDRAGELSRLRPGVVFIGLDEATSVLAEEAWTVALIEVGELVASASDGEAGRDVAVLTEALLDAVDDHRETRTIALGASDPDGEDAYDALRSLADAYLSGAAIYGIARANVMVAYALAAEAPKEDRDGEDSDSADGSDDVEFDNGLGGDPEFLEYVAVSGPLAPSAGLVYVELPGEGMLDGGASGEDAVFAQLREATEQAEREAIARQALLEALDEARERIAELEDRVAGLGSGGAAAAPVDARLDAALAREQQLRWEVARLEAELEQARGADVTPEELAQESRRLEREGGSSGQGATPPHDDSDLDASDPDGEDGSADNDGSADEEAAWDEDDGMRLVVDLGEDERDRQLSRWEIVRQRCLAQLEATLRRVERAGLTGIELHRALSKVRAALRRGAR
jgi:hypothetical protein